MEDSEDDSMGVDSVPPEGSCCSEETDDEDIYSEEAVSQMRRRLACHAKVYMSLKDVYHGCTKKLRFTILVPCPLCKVAHHLVDANQEGLHADAKAEVCPKCRNIQCATKEVHKVHVPIGTRHGTSAVFRRAGSVGYHKIRGDIVVTFLDERHEHFLPEDVVTDEIYIVKRKKPSVELNRIEDDLIVCYQIDSTESLNGVVRLLKLDLSPPREIVLKTEPGQLVRNNDFFYVNGLGLPNALDHSRTGKLFVLFVVKQEKSMFPVKLDCIRAYPKLSKSNKLRNKQIRLTDVACGSTSTQTENGRSPKKSNKRKKRRIELGGDSENCENVHDPEGRDELRRKFKDEPGRMSRADIERQPALDIYCLSFLDRIVYRQTIPMPHRAEVDEIPMAELRGLWDRIRSRSWWSRVEQGKSYLDQAVVLRSGACESRRRWCGADEELPLFDVVGSTVRSSEAVMTHITRRSIHDPDYPSFTLKKLALLRTKHLLFQVQNYIQLAPDL